MECILAIPRAQEGHQVGLGNGSTLLLKSGEYLLTVWTLLKQQWYISTLAIAKELKAI